MQMLLQGLFGVELDMPIHLILFHIAYLMWEILLAKATGKRPLAGQYFGEKLNPFSSEEDKASKPFGSLKAKGGLEQGSIGESHNEDWY